MTTKTITLGAFDVVGKSLSATVTVIDSAFPATKDLELPQNSHKTFSVGSSADFDSDGVSDIVENVVLLTMVMVMVTVSKTIYSQ